MKKEAIPKNNHIPDVRKKIPSETEIQQPTAVEQNDVALNS